MHMKETTIEALEEHLRQAMLNSDISTLDELIADDLLFTLPTGLVIDKQTDLEAHRSGIQKFIRIEIDDRQIHHYGDWAVVTLKAEITAKVFSGTYRFTRVWAKRQNRWQIVAGHASQVAE
ncbi:nuclear transport factor 2 family protein [Cyanobacteria bacterium FACHB-63]|nr:nuclear transport factor 2 family protein [Cyanobacteria bacterium FACHB-63]